MNALIVPIAFATCCIVTFTYHKVKKVWQDSYDIKNITEVNCPLIYSKEEPGVAISKMCKDNELKQPFEFGKVPPKWMIHDSNSWKPWITEFNRDHLVAAFFGIVSNSDLDLAIRNLPSNQTDNIFFAEAIFGSGVAMKNMSMILKDRLQIASTLCAASYEGYKKASIDVQNMFGRCAFAISSKSHHDAAVIGYKIAPPIMLAEHGPPWKNEPGFQPVDLEVSIIFRGSASLADWVTNFAFWLADTNEQAGLPSIKTHFGFLDRHKRMWPLIVQNIRNITEVCKEKGFDLNKVRFALGGHSQGGALATLMALALSNYFPDSTVNLYTFSSPAIFESDPLTSTCIRHMRFAVDNDLVPMQWLGRQHAGSRQIIVDGKLAKFSRLGAHSLKKYKKVIDAISARDLTFIKEN